MKNRNIQMVVGVLMLIMAVLLGIQAVAVRHWFDGSGISFLIPAILLFIIGSVLCRSELGIFFLYALLVTFLAIGFHVQPHVTSSELLCTHEDNCADAPQLLRDENVYCGPFVGCQYNFECVSRDGHIHRSDRCIHCGRPFSHHYPLLYTIKKWISKVMNDRTLAELDYMN